MARQIVQRFKWIPKVLERYIVINVFGFFGKLPSRNFIQVKSNFIFGMSSDGRITTL